MTLNFKRHDSEHLTNNGANFKQFALEQAVARTHNKKLKRNKKKKGDKVC